MTEEERAVERQFQACEDQVRQDVAYGQRMKPIDFPNKSPSLHNVSNAATSLLRLSRGLQVQAAAQTSLGAIIRHLPTVVQPYDRKELSTLPSFCTIKLRRKGKTKRW